jgi:predicted transposase/invertase (TIGR01784 family)
MIEEYHQEELQQKRYEEGLEEGEKEAKRLIAKKCLLTGIAPDLVAEATGLSGDEIAELGR